MGRTLYGVDLDESPFGGLIERLLTEEELEMLADGGRPDGSVDDADDRDDADANGGSVDEGGSADEDEPIEANRSVDDDRTAEAGDETAAVDDRAVDDRADERGDAVSADSFTWGDTPVDSSTGTRDFGVGSGETGGPGDGVDPFAPPGGGDYGAGGADEDEEESGGVLSKLAAHRGLLLKASVALALVAVVAAVVWKYLGSVKAVVPDRLSGDDESDDEAAGPGPVRESADTDEPLARRRAKMDAPVDEDGTGVESDAAAVADTDDSTDDSVSDRSSRRDRRPRDRSPAEPPSPNEDVDLGALVGLGALALMAAVVRKFGEDRPHDPLVDGPEEE